MNKTVLSAGLVTGGRLSEITPEMAKAADEGGLTVRVALRNGRPAKPAKVLLLRKVLPGLGRTGKQK